MANEKILVVDDDKNICELLRLYLVKEGYNVTMVHDGGAALAEFDKLHPDLVLLDVMMPVMDGWEVCRKLRAKDNTPIIMLTAKGETYDKVLGLELGADDYIVKPFDAKEVTARIKAVLRRSSAKEEENKGVYDFDNLHLDMNRYELKVKGKVVEAPPKELELLEAEKQAALEHAKEIAAKDAKKEEIPAPSDEEKTVFTQRDLIQFEDFEKIQLVVAKVLKCEKVPKADKLLMSTLKGGDTERVVVSGIAKFYTPEEMVGKKVVLLANLAPRKIRGVESHGMLLCAANADDSKLSLLTVDSDMEDGCEIG